MWNQQLFTGGSPADLLEIACDNPNHQKVPTWWAAKVPANDEARSSGSGRNLLIEERQAGLRKAVWKEINQKSKLLYMLAKSAEETITAVMHEIEEQSAGQLIGIEFRLKELPSIQRKLIFETSQSTSKTIQEVMNTRMTDTLRYTILYPTNTYVNQAAKLVDMLCQAKKYQSFELRNYWETGHAYDGLNCSFLTDDHEAGGVLFEVQVHTPESFDVRQYKSHALYELWRGLDHPQQKYLVFTQMVDLFDSVPRPPGDLLSIGSLNRKTSPQPDGFLEWLEVNQVDVEMLKQKNYAYFGVDVHDMEKAPEGQTIVSDRANLFGGKGKFVNPMNAPASEGAGAAGGDGGWQAAVAACWAKVFCGMQLPCLPASSDGSAPLMSGMRSEARTAAPIQNPMFAAAPVQEQYAFIRHAEAEHNVLFRSGKADEGLQILDPKLTDKGKRQAEALGRYIESEGLEFDLVICSPLTRALETCEIVFSNIAPEKVVITPLHSETGVDEEGNERVGTPCRSGRKPGQLRAQFPAGWNFDTLDDRAMWDQKEDGSWCHPQPKEERIDAFRDYLLESPASTDKVAIVGHAAFFQTFVDVKMTSCQMIWKEVTKEDEVLDT